MQIGKGDDPFPLRQVEPDAVHRSQRFPQQVTAAITMTRRYLPPAVTTAISIGTVHRWAGIEGADKKGRFFRTPDGKLISFDSLSQKITPSGYKRPVTIRGHLCGQFDRHLQPLEDSLTFFTNKLERKLTGAVMLRRKSCIAIDNRGAFLIMDPALGGHEAFDELAAIGAEFPNLFRMEG